jgi:D-lactate dehydrogenase
VGEVRTRKNGVVFATILKGFGCGLLGHDVAENPDCIALGMRYMSLPELLGAADIVSLHAPLTPQTHHLINAESLARMKPGAILINTSRGGLIDTEALIEALRAGRLQGVGLDVYEEEEGKFFGPLGRDDRRHAGPAVTFGASGDRPPA